MKHPRDPRQRRIERLGEFELGSGSEPAQPRDGVGGSSQHGERHLVYAEERGLRYVYRLACIHGD